MASAVVSHLCKRVSPRTLVLQMWCHLSECNEPLPDFNQSSLLGKEVEKEVGWGNKEEGKRIYSKEDKLHVMLSSKCFAHLHAIQKSPGRKFDKSSDLINQLITNGHWRPC